jgi:hypothetical protein
MRHTQDTHLPRRRLPAKPRRSPLVGLAISLATLAALVALALTLAGAEPTLAHLTPATALDDGFEPVEVTDTFKPDATFFVSAKIANYRSDQSIKARWRLNGENIGDTPLTTNGTQGNITAGFSLSRQLPWPAGRYTVDILNGDKILGGTSFSVKP